MSQPVHNFLITFATGEGTRSVEDLGTDVLAAMETFRDREQEVLGTDVGVVLLNADSLETVKATHSSYFDGARDLLRDL
ncbi:MAG TPA: hypothetical protein VN238_15980 [Solirubrobacteraceae bacterium]|nr:hypothetical protein [Solirubrobacteraceae bacterium]